MADWLLAFFGMALELEEHRALIRRLEDRLRDQGGSRLCAVPHTSLRRAKQPRWLRCGSVAPGQNQAGLRFLELIGLGRRRLFFAPAGVLQTSHLR